MTIYSWTLSSGSDWDSIGFSYFGVTWRHNLKIDVSLYWGTKISDFSTKKNLNPKN